MTDSKDYQILFEGAQKIMEKHGMNFPAPWQSSLDDEENEKYVALRDVIAFMQLEDRKNLRL